MFEAATIETADKAEFYRQLAQQTQALFDGETDMIANAANMSALIYQMLPDLNWAGVYLLKGDQLVLGPFQGKPACVRIPIGRGVCGAAIERKTSILVEDVTRFRATSPVMQPRGPNWWSQSSKVKRRLVSSTSIVQGHRALIPMIRPVLSGWRRFSQRRSNGSRLAVADPICFRTSRRSDVG